MNLPACFPVSFDRVQWELNKSMAALIPTVTMDHTSGHYFSAPFTMEDIEWAKLHIKKHPSNSACGQDHVSYGEIEDVPNEDLLALFQSCIDSGDAPDVWLTTYIVGVLKNGKPANNPESYRLIGLESCLLKVLTLLIAKRLCAWVAECQLLPASQNGFREGYRTNNNAFSLRCAIDKARAMGMTLYVSFVDCSNAFPWTDHPTLWLKLY